MTHTCADSARSACARALADVAVARDDRDLAGDHHVGRALDAVDQRFAAAVQVVELRLGDRVVDVDRRERQPAFLFHLVQAMHAGGGLFGHALMSARGASSTSPASLSSCACDRREQHASLPRWPAWRCTERILLGLRAEVQRAASRRRRRRGSCWRAAVRPLEDAVRVFPVLVERFAFVREHRRAALRRSRRRRDPASRRCCTMPSARRRRAPAASRSAPRSGWSCAASPAMRAPFSGCLRLNSSRIAIRPGISVSAIAISLRPQCGQRQVGDLVVGEIWFA